MFECDTKPEWTSNTSTYKPCKHKNGWYDNIKFLCFNIPVYFCIDCETAIYGKELKMMK